MGVSSEALDGPGRFTKATASSLWFIDGNKQQQEALVAILTAQDPGLPWEILAATISDISGPFFEKIDIEDNGTDSHVRVGDKFELKMETFKDPVTGAPHEVHTVLPDGFIFQDARICTSSVHRVNADGVAFDHPGKNAYYSEVEWSSQNRMAPTEAAGRF